MTKYADWIRYFEQNHWPEFTPGPPLTDEERKLIAKSLRQFQLGEGSDGQTLYHLGRQFAQASGESDYPRSLALFIKEEQRHSAKLGDFLDHQGIPRQTKDAVDNIFRCVRKLWRHECMVTVLVSAECVAVPYYSALHDATASPHLKALCRQILKDENLHLKYQGDTLAKLAENRGFWMSSATRTLQRLMVLGASLVVYAQHKDFCDQAGWPLKHFLGSAFQALDVVERRLPGSALIAFGWSNPTKRAV